MREPGETEMQTPNQDLRHSFKTQAPKVGMDAEARGAIQVHAPKTEGQD